MIDLSLGGVVFILASLSGLLSFGMPWRNLATVCVVEFDIGSCRVRDL